MAARPVLALMAGALLTVVGCGGSSGSAKAGTETSTASTPSAAALPATVRTALAARLSAAPSIADEKSPAPPTYVTGVTFAANDPDAAERQRFRAEGLQAAATQHLHVPGADDGIRAVLLFATADAARQDAEAAAKNGPPNSTTETFAVPIPGAIGTDVSGPGGQVGGRNVVFTVGRYEYTFGIAPTAGSTQTPSRATITAAAAQWYRKVTSLS